MSTSQDCQEIRHHIIAVFCHDFGAIVGTMASYVALLEMERDGNFDDDMNTGEILEIAKASRSNSESSIQSIINYIQAHTSDCDSATHDILEQFDAVYDNHFRKWYSTLDDLERTYTRDGHLDNNLLNQLTAHSEQLVALRNQLLDEIRPDKP